MDLRFPSIINPRGATVPTDPHNINQPTPAATGHKRHKIMRQDLKNSIALWLVRHADTWQRVNECKQAYHDYIYDQRGNYLQFGGQEVSDFIDKCDALLYGKL